MKKRKINIGNTLIAALILIFLIVCLVMLFKSLKKDFKVDMNTKTIQVGEEFTNEFKAYYKGIDVTYNVKIDTNLNNNKSGVYDIKYNYSKNNKTYTIKYRNVYNRTKLNQQRYFMVNDKFMDTQNAIAYGNKFSHFEYKWSVN